MSENNNTIDRDNNAQDEEFKNMLKEVFGQKDKIINERNKENIAQKNAVRKAADSVPPAKKPVQHNSGHTANSQQQRPVKSNAQAKRYPGKDISFKKPDVVNMDKAAQSRINVSDMNSRVTANKKPQQKTQKAVPASAGVASNNANRKPASKPATNKSRANADRKPATNTNKNGNEKLAQVKKRKVLTEKQRAKRIIALILAAILVLLIAGVCIYHFYYSMFGRYEGKRNNGEYQYNDSDYTDESNTMTAKQAEEALKKQLEGKATDLMKDKDVMNILLIGEDLRDTEDEDRGNTDVMLMISLNHKKNTITMTSFMRDAWVEIDDYGMAKLNAAYWIDGPELLKDTIQKHYGVSIDRYVIVNFESFMKIVDTLGGITLDVTDEEAEGMKAPMAEQNNILGNKKGTDYLDKGGKLKLNGNQALAFARLRYVGNADYERTERQRRVINEIIKESKHLSLVKIHSLLKEILPEIKIDLTEGEVASLLLNCFDYMDYEVQELRIPADEMFSEEIIDGLSVLCPDFQANTREIIKTVYGQEALDKYDEENGIESQEKQESDYNNVDVDTTLSDGNDYYVDDNYNYDNNYDNNYNDYGYDNNNYGYDYNYNYAY